MNKVSLQGVIDMHVHTNPDLRHRAYDDFELTDAAVRVGARAIVIKTHQGMTMDRAYLCNCLQPARQPRQQQLYYVRQHYHEQGHRRNQPRGGGNCLEAGLQSSLAPTASARNHIEKLNLDMKKCVEVVRDGKVVPEMNDVFQLVKDYDAVLGTAHVSPEECFVVVEAARKAGVKKIVVTHPEWWLVNMSVEDQVRMVKDYDVILERCYAQNMGGGKYKSNLPSNLEIIQTVGYEHVMVDTDGGQVENPHWELALQEYMQYLVDHGIPEEQVYHMTHTIPAGLLGLED